MIKNDLQNYDNAIRKASGNLPKVPSKSEMTKYEDVSLFNKTEEEETKTTTQIDEAEDASWWDTAMKYKDVYSGTLKGTDGFGDFCSKQNYLGGQIIGGIQTGNGFPSVDELEEMNKSWDTLKEKDEFEVLKNNLSKEDNEKAMDVAIKMLEEQIKFNRSELPEYGDCKDYYNDGNLTDWVLTHPVGIGLDKIAEATDWEGYNNFKENYLAKDGMFTLQNIPGYIWGKEGEDDWTDIFTVKSVDSITAEVEKQEKLLEQLKNSKDKPEEFAKIYHEITNGINFDAEKVLNYSENKTNANGEKITETEIVGRNFTYEDIGKNRLGTNVLFEVNKTVGTKLCGMIPVGGTLVAYGTNVGVSVLENKTSGENEDKKTTMQILGEEGIRTFAVLGGSKVKENISKNTGVENKWTVNGMFSSGKAFLSDTVGDYATIADTVGDIANGNDVSWGSAIASAANIFIVPGAKSTGAAILKSFSNFKFW